MGLPVTGPLTCPNEAENRDSQWTLCSTFYIFMPISFNKDKTPFSIKKMAGSRGREPWHSHAPSSSLLTNRDTAPHTATQHARLSLMIPKGSGVQGRERKRIKGGREAANTNAVSHQPSVHLTSSSLLQDAKQTLPAEAKPVYLQRPNTNAFSWSPPNLFYNQKITTFSLC